MKKAITVLFTLATVSLSAQWWSNNKVEGNGNIQKITRNVEIFSALSSSGSFNVELSFGKPGAITIEGDENLLEYIETKVENNTLTIKTRKDINISTRKKMTVYVTMSKLEGISLSGSGNIHGSGDFGNEGTSKFKISGSGNITLNFDRIKSAEVSISGSGKANFTGKTEQLNVKISGSGNVDCIDMLADRTEVNISGSGNARVYAEKSLEANIAGRGNVYYRGNANEIMKHTSGSGKITKL